MKSVRRLYIYLVAIISLEVVIWGLIGLLRTIFSNGLVFGADTLAQALSFVLVGIPIFGLHWFWAQRSADDMEEQSSTIRGIFLYATLLATLIPVVQNLLALVNRNLILATGINAYFSFVGGNQSTIDNLIAIGLNLLVAYYFYRVLKTKLDGISQDSHFKEVYQLYGYVWVVYSLFLALFGVQEIIRFLFYQPGVMIGPAGKEYFINGLAMCLIGTPLWVYSWQHRQKIDQDPSIERSAIRLVLLFILSLMGVITVLTMTSLAAYQILLKFMGADIPLLQLISRVGNPVSVAVTLGIVWFYYGKWFHNEVEERYQDVQKRSVFRLHTYLLSLIGLVAMITGIALLATFLINVSTGHILWGEVLRRNLAAAVATLISAFPLWVLVWNPIQDEALLESPIGSEARRSIIRRSYLYIAVFGTVIGGMVTAIALVNTILFGVLDHTDSSFLPTIFKNLSLLVLFILFLLYHLRVLRHDGAFTKDVAIREGKVHSVNVWENSNDSYHSLLAVELAKAKQGITLLRVNSAGELPQSADSGDLLILPASFLLEESSREVVKKWTGPKFIIPNDMTGYNWVGVNGFNPKDVAHAINAINEDKEVKPASGTKGWQIVAYIAAILFAAQTVLMVFALIMSLIFGG